VPHEGCLCGMGRASAAWGSALAGWWRAVAACGLPSPKRAGLHRMAATLAGGADLRRMGAAFAGGGGPVSYEGCSRGMGRVCAARGLPSRKGAGLRHKGAALAGKGRACAARGLPLRDGAGRCHMGAALAGGDRLAPQGSCLRWNGRAIAAWGLLSRGRRGPVPYGSCPRGRVGLLPHRGCPYWMGRGFAPHGGCPRGKGLPSREGRVCAAWELPSAMVVFRIAGGVPGFGGVAGSATQRERNTVAVA
jgi:hypothetical protein